MALKYFKKFITDRANHSKDPIDAAKNMVSSIQIFVGVHNVFGDPNRRITPFSVLGILIFAGAFIYVGTISQTLYLITVFPDKLESFKAVNCISSTCVPLSKYVFMWTSSKRLKKIFEMSHEGLNSTQETSARSKIIGVLQKGRYVSYLVIFNVVTTHIFYLTLPLLFTIFGNDRYLPSIPGEIYGVGSRHDSPYYEIAFTLIVIATGFSAINQTGYIVLFVSLLSNELGHFYAITDTLNQINAILTNRKPLQSTVDREKAVDEKLKFCIKHHQFLMKYHEKIRKLYKVVFGYHFLMMTLVLVTTLQTMNAWNISNTILTGVTGVIPLFVYCFGGELLLSAETDMSAAVYSCGWELMKAKQARVVLFMLMLSQRPLYLTAADTFIMNREMFGDVVQVVYKIYAVFN